ncbi:MAG: RNase adapter RapZ [Deltaproteobacteria bacterium]|nr:MAG: RNase adapter RapZ [Deltaproteobacteria bacterium]PIE74943.1 MAG: RNase adapter RapZ [Deltaproteobacteria bacterium]
MKNTPIIIITGESGSGKSSALNAFEDCGFYCVDNMPLILLPKFLELPIKKKSEGLNGIAFGMDLRELSFASDFPETIDFLKKNNYKYKILFLTADENTLIKRYSQTRRHHPLSKDTNLKEGIRNEKNILKNLKNESDIIIDTTNYNVHELKSKIVRIAAKYTKTKKMRIDIVSFGFKYGVPNGIDLLMDVRFLPNPYFVSELKEKTGEDNDVKEFVLTKNRTKQFLEKFTDLLDYLIPLYKTEGKAYLTIGIGCTGGKHRSVVISNYLFKYIDKHATRSGILHRDITR